MRPGLENPGASGQTAAFFLVPGDMPRVQSATLVRLMAEWDQRPAGILHPRYEGRRGHPPLIAAA
jgi:CTP:molybdopterin cytidylyltransferase MocA